MIPKIKYNLIADLIEYNPLLFKNTAMIGIFDGQDICSCFLNNASYLNRLYFYENFHDSQQDKEKEKLLSLYESWKNSIPNLEIFIGDGTKNLVNTHIDFLFSDAYNIDYKTYFLNNRFDNTLLAICGYGAELVRTIDVSVCIDNRKIFPILLHNGFLFFVNNSNLYDKTYPQIKKFLDIHNIEYTNRKGCLRPNGWYHSLLKTETQVLNG
jgi:hypothetical protein